VLAVSYDNIYKVDASIVAPGITVEIRNYQFPSPFEGTAERSRHTMSMALSARVPYSQLACRYGPDHTSAWIDTGDVIFLPAGMVTLCRGVGGAQRRLCCNFSTDVFPQASAQMDPAWPERDLKACFDVQASAIKRDLYRLANEVAEPSATSGDFVEAMGKVLWIELSRYLDQSRRFRRLDHVKMAPWQLRRITDYVESLVQPSPTIEELAKLCDLSPRHLGRAFKDSMGQTIGDYVKQARLLKAKSLLVDTQLSNKEIAYRLGFSSSSSFSVAFGKAVAMTPKQFRQAHREIIKEA
jgi:AraC family transcriptional regulator